MPAAANPQPRIVSIMNGACVRVVDRLLDSRFTHTLTPKSISFEDMTPADQCLSHRGLPMQIHTAYINHTQGT